MTFRSMLMANGYAMAQTLLMMALAPMPATATTPMDVVASFSIIADMAKHVGADRVNIVALVGPGGDAHVYEPKPADAIAISKADVVLVNGLAFEGFLPRLVKASNTRAPIAELTENIEWLDHTGQPQADKPQAYDTHDNVPTGHHQHGRYDPHAWQSVRHAHTYVDNIVAAFCLADATGCDTYQTNAQAYKQQLSQLDAEIREAIADVPPTQRVVITSHGAFNYFGHEYGLHFLAAEGLSTEAEASAADMAALIRQIRQGQATAIFLENMANPRLIKQIARETGVAIGGTLYSDALSKQDGPAPTYIDMMRHNVKTIVEAVR